MYSYNYRSTSGPLAYCHRMVYEITILVCICMHSFFNMVTVVVLGFFGDPPFYVGRSDADVRLRSGPWPTTGYLVIFRRMQIRFPFLIFDLLQKGCRWRDIRYVNVCRWISCGMIWDGLKWGTVVLRVDVFVLFQWEFRWWGEFSNRH